MSTVVSPAALAALTCPICLDSLLLGLGEPSASELQCDRCGTRYAIEDGIPVLVPPARDDGDAAKARQAAFFDEHTDEEYEITRPRGTPDFHAWLLAEKFRRSITGITSLVPGCTALTVCGGSGLDAEYLARRGAQVVSSDISHGAARRARERARRFGVALTPLVADVERLPFRSRSIDLVYVHDGLHHSERPLAGLQEMARVARRAVSVTEPARAALTAAAVRLGAAQAREEAGNAVERLTLEDVAGELRAQGLHIVAAERYGMLYRHEPGRVSAWLSRPGVLPLAQGAHRGANRVAGRLGNKLTVQGVRPARG